MIEIIQIKSILVTSYILLALDERVIPIILLETFCLVVIGGKKSFPSNLTKLWLPRCTVEGEYINGRTVFPDLSCPLRTDESFRCMDDESHHKSVSPLAEQLPWIGMVSRFPLDYMHLVCLGKVMFSCRPIFWQKSGIGYWASNSRGIQQKAGSGLKSWSRLISCSASIKDP